MAVGIVGREVESAALDEFLRSAAAAPVSLVLEGERGIGKTTVWLDGVERARVQGWRVLATRPVEAESVLSYGSLADLLGGLDPDVFAGLPEPQRFAVDRVMLRGGESSAPTDPRAVAAAFLSVIDTLSSIGPVLLAVDDLQWLDRSSVAALAFAARRLSGPVGLLATLRTETGYPSDSSWLLMPRPDSITRITVGPVSPGALHAIVMQRLRRSLSRPTVVRIHEISRGNPFYAIELARAKADALNGDDTAFPPTLSQLLSTRLNGLGPEVDDIVLAAACAAAPTIELVAHATDNDHTRVTALLADAEANGIIGYDGQRLRFGHPVLAAAIYAGASPARRRAMHRRLAGIVTEPELQARHLALAVTVGDAATLNSLDAAARSAGLRGAPAAAAELLELAIGLGGDTPERRVELARNFFHAGDAHKASELLETTVRGQEAGIQRARALALLGLVRLFDESFVDAAAVLERSLGDVRSDSELGVEILVTLAFALVNSGALDEAVSRADAAVSAAVGLGEGHVLAPALSMRAVLRFMRGDGLDDHLQRALELEDPAADTPVAFRPSAQHALLLAWTGRLDQGSEALLAVLKRCRERGQESELIFMSFHAVLAEVWRGNFGDAGLIAEDFMVRAVQLGGDLPLSAALTCRAVSASYHGRVDDARRDAAEALAASRRCGSARLGEWPLTTLGFVAVSRREYSSAVTTLEPLLEQLLATPANTEIISASFVPDLVEALIGVGRPDDAEPLITLMERNGRRLDRAWMLACGARCRAMLLAARGDLDAAVEAASDAMTEHRRLPMPFERARTQLLFGQLERRQRRNHTAAKNLLEALATFEQLDTPLWADRARTELGRANVGPRQSAKLTPSERRVAELAASGMTNRDVAAVLFVSPKTVEANLARVYRKLGIRSRAELGRLMAED